ncbi:MAG: hypothetical protein HDR22_04570 [Lachnospiraceae bacterium]|nr:hypothetical protein [Lachnospiraceae bacterium]
MKITDKKKPIDTIPKGVWESSRPVRDKKKNNTATPSADQQGNGYPIEKQNKQDM